MTQHNRSRVRVDRRHRRLRRQRAHPHRVLRPAAADDAASANEFSFTFATSNNLESPYQTLANDYMEANADVTITTNPTPNDKYGETIRTQFQAGNASDVIQTTPGSGDARGLIGLAEAGFLEPLGDTAAGLVPAGQRDRSSRSTARSTASRSTSPSVRSSPASATPFRMGVTDFTWPETMDDLYAACDGARRRRRLAVRARRCRAARTPGLMAQAIAATRVYAEDPDWNQQRARR